MYTCRENDIMGVLADAFNSKLVFRKHRPWETGGCLFIWRQTTRDVPRITYPCGANLPRLIAGSQSLCSPYVQQ